MLSLLARSGMVSATRLTGAGLTFVTQLLLARLLGPEALGIYFIALSAAAIAAILGCLGFPGTAARFVARYHARSRFGLETSFVQVTQQEVIIASSVIALALAGGAVAAFDRQLAVALALAALAIPALSIMRINGALALAGRHPWVCYVPDMLARPLALLLMLAAAFWAGLQVGLVEVLVMALVSTFAAAAVQVRQVGRMYGRQKLPPRASGSLRRLWRNASIPLIPAALLAGLFPELNLLLLSPMMEPEQIAVYGVALKLAFLAGFGIQASQQLIMRDVADAVARADAVRLRSALRRTLGVSCLVALVALVGLAAAGPLVLALFGPQFQSASAALLILVAAQAARVPGAIAVQLLTLLGHQLRVVVGTAMTALVLAATSVILVQNGALEGAAWAVLTTFLVSSLLFAAIAVFARPQWLRQGGPAAGRSGQGSLPTTEQSRLRAAADV